MKVKDIINRNLNPKHDTIDDVLDHEVLTIEFSYFLHRKGALAHFIWNLKDGLAKDMKLDHFCELNERTPTMVILNAFPWGDTNQGHRYWEDLHNEWLQVKLN